jgi:signal transduction histidine kinase
VTLDQDGPLARLLVADDGVGFAAHDDGPRRGLGLRGMAERAAQVGGHLSVESTPGRGTLVRLEVSQ